MEQARNHIRGLELENVSLTEEVETIQSVIDFCKECSQKLEEMVNTASILILLNATFGSKFLELDLF